LIAGTAVAGYVLLSDDDPKVTARSLSESLKDEAPTARLVACERDSSTSWICDMEYETEGVEDTYDVTVDADGCWTASAETNTFGSGAALTYVGPAGKETRRGCIGGD
jgi:hypothetical protein